MNAKVDDFPMWLRALALILSPFRAPGYSIKQDHTAKFDALLTVGYSELRNNVLDGDLLFCGGNYGFSKAIRYLSGKSAVSHVGITYWWNERLMLLESVETDGVRMVPLSQYIADYENSGKAYDGRLYLARDRRLYRAPENPGARASSVRNPAVEALLCKAATLLNKRFSFWDVIVFFWQGNTGRARYVANDQFLCSEFVAECFRGVGITYPDDGRGFIAPEHIAMSDDIAALVEIRKEKVETPVCRPWVTPAAEVA